MGYSLIRSLLTVKITVPFPTIEVEPLAVLTTHLGPTLSSYSTKSFKLLVKWQDALELSIQQASACSSFTQRGQYTKE